MAYTFLQAVNKAARLVSIVTNSSGEFTSLVDSSRQPMLDILVQHWNDMVQEIYTVRGKPTPRQVDENFITLVTAQREYTLPINLVEIEWPLISEANGYTIHEYRGGYEQMRREQTIPSQHTGRPEFGAISPINRKLRVDRAPTAGENGVVYRMVFSKYTLLADPNEVFPFHDAVTDALAPCVAELYRRDKQGQFDLGKFNLDFGRAARLLNPEGVRSHY